MDVARWQDNQPLLWTGRHAAGIVLFTTLLGACVTRHRASFVMRHMRIVPRDMISIGAVLLIASGAQTFVAMLLSFRRSELGQPPLDLAWWVGIGFHFPMIVLPPIGFFLIIFGIVKRVSKRPRLVVYPPRNLADEELIFFPIPSLVSLLLRAESEKGQPLTEFEVIAIRDGCTCIALPPEVAAATAKDRGYNDIDPEHCWEQWQHARIELSNGG